MTHVLSHQKKLFFIHIPKNGGSSVRDQILRFDDSGRRYEYQPPVASQAGPVQLGHAPLAVIKELFPEDLKAIESYSTYAILREPISRFRSAFSQRCREFLNNDLEDLTGRERRQELDRIIRHLLDHPVLLEPDFCHFMRQRDFVFLDQQKIIQNTFPLERIGDLLAALSAHLNEPLTETRTNKTSVNRRGAASIVSRQLWRAVKPVVPTRLETLLRNTLRPLVVSDLGANVFPEVDEPDVMSVLKNYYQADFDIYAASKNAVN